jgi:hypothetical protein
MRTVCAGLVLAGFAVVSCAPPLCSADAAKPEPGYTPLFNGKNLDGWQTKAGEPLDGKTEAFKGRFKVVEGKIVIVPKVKGDVVIQTAKKLPTEVTIKFEFYPGKGCNNDLFFRGKKFDLTNKVTKNLKEGEWNQFEIVSRGDEVEWKNNGETQRTDKVKGPGTPLGLRAEFGPNEYRRLRFKGLP